MTKSVHFVEKNKAKFDAISMSDAKSNLSLKRAELDQQNFSPKILFQNQDADCDPC